MLVSFFPGKDMVISEMAKIQICFFDRSMWLSDFKIVDRCVKPTMKFNRLTRFCWNK